MNRVIKFRVWDGNKMNFPNIIAINEGFTWNHDRSYLHNCTEWNNENGFIENPILMQFTGLTDKNGVEIYEGDVVKSPDEDIDYCIVEWDKKQACFQINGYGRTMYFNEGGGEEYSNDISRIEDNILILGSDYIEVIGNMHEHPHLLTN